MENKVDNHLIESLLREHFADAVLHVEESYGMLDITVQREKIIDILQWLRDHSILQFNFLTSMNGMHFPDAKNKELSVVYHLHSFYTNVRMRLHVFFSNWRSACTHCNRFVECSELDGKRSIRFLRHPIHRPPRPAQNFKC